MIWAPASEILVILSWAAHGRSHVLSSRLPASCTPYRKEATPPAPQSSESDEKVGGWLWPSPLMDISGLTLPLFCSTQPAQAGYPSPKWAWGSVVCFRNKKGKSSHSGISQNSAVRHFSWHRLPVSDWKWDLKAPGTQPLACATCLLLPPPSSLPPPPSRY